MEKIREALHLRKTGKIEEARQLLLQLTKKEINNGSVFYASMIN
ncbi:hypothetical protein [Bacillus aquiflavi]|nr:hypothetical protein [Bacillus aquiflavi]